MHIRCLGTAWVVDSSSGERYEIEPKELDWEIVGGSERNMGAEIEHTATIDHPALGALTWTVWEYPIGILEYVEHDLNGHSLESDFNIELYEDPDRDYEEPDEDSFDREAAEDEMREWFGENYEDPANSLPYEGREGGYQWVRGGPYTPTEALEEQFGNKYPWELIDEVGNSIAEEAGGLYEWTPVHRPDFDDSDEHRTSETQNQTTRAQKLLRSTQELTRLLKPIITIEQTRNGLNPPSDRGIGHNNPPSPLEEIGLNPDFFKNILFNTEELSHATANIEIAHAVQTDTPSSLTRLISSLDRNTKISEHLTSALNQSIETNQSLSIQVSRNAAAVESNTLAIREAANTLADAIGKIGKFSISAFVLDRFFGGALERLGTMLVDSGVELIGDYASTASQYLISIHHALNEVIASANQYIHFSSFMF